MKDFPLDLKKASCLTIMENIPAFHEEKKNNMNDSLNLIKCRHLKKNIRLFMFSTKGVNRSLLYRIIIENIPVSVRYDINRKFTTRVIKSLGL